jgi:hypothetical protein
MCTAHFLKIGCEARLLDMSMVLKLYCKSFTANPPLQIPLDPPFSKGEDRQEHKALSKLELPFFVETVAYKIKNLKPLNAEAQRR